MDPMSTGLPEKSDSFRRLILTEKIWQVTHISGDMYKVNPQQVVGLALYTSANVEWY